MRIVLDTGVFFRPDALRALVDAPAPVVVPAVVLAERARQLRARGKDPHLLLDLVEASAWSVEPFGADEALVVSGVVDDARWRRLARDALVAAHVRPGDALWTTNPRDFAELGLAPAQVVAV